MTLMKTRILVLQLLLLALVACNTHPAPMQNTTETEFSNAYITFYGSYYDTIGIEQNVLMLDIFGRKIDQDSAGHLFGSGTNFGFTDVFLPAGITRLEEAEGTFRADTTGEAFTFLPGVNYEGYPTGTYLQNATDGIVRELILFTDGEFCVTQDNDTTVIDFRLTYEEYGRTHTYEAHYRGILNYLEWNRQ